MPVKLDPPPPAKSEQPGVTTSLLYNGSRFKGHQKSKGNCYDVEVILQVCCPTHIYFVILGVSLVPRKCAGTPKYIKKIQIVPLIFIKFGGSVLNLRLSFRNVYGCYSLGALLCMFLEHWKNTLFFTNFNSRSYVFMKIL